MKRSILPLAALLAIGLAAACSGGSDAPLNPAPPQTVARVVLSGGAATLAPDQSVRFSAVAQSQNGSPVEGAVIEWTTSNAAIATVDPDGTVRGVGGGEARITARAGAHSADANIIVVPADVRLGGVAVIGNGRARAWLRLDGSGRVDAIGVTLTAGALTGLPTALVVHALELPAEAASTLFQHVYFDWYPQGHVPAGVYTQPHYDFHWYMIPSSEREQITMGPGRANLEPRYRPAGHFTDGEVIPGMGVHWMDGASHEFHGQGFTETMIFGSYNGRHVFYDNMVTRAYLLQQPNVTRPIAQPAEYQRSGAYPTFYTIRYDAVTMEYTVMIHGFVQRAGT